jgi:hypothetical protein
MTREMLFFNEIVKHFSEKGYTVEQEGPLDLIIKKGNLTIPVEIKCRTKRVKNNNMFTVSFTLNELMLLKKKKGILMRVDDGREFYEFKVV